MTDDSPDETTPLTDERIVWVLVALVAVLLLAKLGGVDPTRLPDPSVLAALIAAIVTIFVGRR